MLEDRREGWNYYVDNNQVWVWNDVKIDNKTTEIIWSVTWFLLKIHKTETSLFNKSISNLVLLVEMRPFYDLWPVLEMTPESLGVNSLWSGLGVLGAVSNCWPRARELERDGQPRDSNPPPTRAPSPASGFIRWWFLGVATGVADVDRVPGAVLPIMFM